LAKIFVAEHVAVDVGEAVEDGVDVGVSVEVEVSVGVQEKVGVAVGLSVEVGVQVGVAVGVCVNVGVQEGVSLIVVQLPSPARSAASMGFVTRICRLPIAVTACPLGSVNGRRGGKPNLNLMWKCWATVATAVAVIVLVTVLVGPGVLVFVIVRVGVMVFVTDGVRLHVFVGECVRVKLWLFVGVTVLVCETASSGMMPDSKTRSPAANIGRRLNKAGPPGLKPN
jgi:hypothetical protein